MSDSGIMSKLPRVFGCLMLIVGALVFLIRLQHAGPYAMPSGGNLLAALLSFVVGGWLVRDWLGTRPLATFIGWVVLLGSPVVLFSALYATLAELEEVVVLKATDGGGKSTELRLWVVDRAGVPWVTMPRSKADAHGLNDAKVDLLRQGELRCVVTVRQEDRETVKQIHAMRQEKYAVQRLATTLGIFGRTAGINTVALRLDPCPPD